MIERIIHFIWLGDDFKESYKYAVRSAQLNTTCKIVLHTNNRALDISGVEMRYIDAPDIKVSCLAHLSDIIRCDILFKEGGIYSDLDVIWLRNPWELFDKKVVIGYSNQSYKILCNAVLMSEKGHPAIKRYRDWLISISPCKNYWLPANPYKLWKDDPDILMLPKKYFFPVSYKRMKEATLTQVQDSICVHLFCSLCGIEESYRRIFGTTFD
jgi:hypothetical protein